MLCFMAFDWNSPSFGYVTAVIGSFGAVVLTNYYNKKNFAEQAIRLAMLEKRQKQLNQSEEEAKQLRVAQEKEAVEIRMATRDLSKQVRSLMFVIKHDKFDEANKLALDFYRRHELKEFSDLSGKWPQWLQYLWRRFILSTVSYKGSLDRFQTWKDHEDVLASMATEDGNPNVILKLHVYTMAEVIVECFDGQFR